MAALSRRVVLVSAGSLGLGWLLGQAWGHRPLQGQPGAALGEGALATLIAALEVLLPEGAPAAQVAADIDAFLADSDPILAEDLSVALLVLEHAGGAGPVAFQRFSRLSRAERTEVLQRWQRSSLLTKRRIADALRRTAAFSWYARPESWASIGYDGPWVGR
jgi:hypothetical protein